MQFGTGEKTCKGVSSSQSTSSSMNSLLIQGCSDLMHFIVSGSKSALLGLWRALLGYQPLSPSWQHALGLLAPFACVYTWHFQSPLRYHEQKSSQGSTSHNTTMDELWWALALWMQPEDKRHSLLGAMLRSNQRLVHVCPARIWLSGNQARLCVPEWCTVGGLLRGGCHSDVAWSVSSSSCPPNSCRITFCTAEFQFLCSWHTDCHGQRCCHAQLSLLLKTENSPNSIIHP